GGWEVIKKYVELGLGISIVASLCLTGKEGLVAIPMKRYFPTRRYGLVMRRGKFMSPQAQRFIEIMAKAAPKRLPAWVPRSGVSAPVHHSSFIIHHSVFPPSLLRDHHVRGFDHSGHVIAGGELHSFDRIAGDRSHDIDSSGRYHDFGRDGSQFHCLDLT